MKFFKIDQYWEFSFNTQRFDSGAAADADALPTYRVYECDTDSGVNETVLQSGNCAKTDDSNTTGYYHCRAQATTAAGYEVGKTYEVRVAATVNSVAGAAVIGRFAILSVNVWDSLYGGTDALETDIVQVGSSTASLAALKAMCDGSVVSTVNDASATDTGFVTALTEASNDHYNGAFLLFTSGALAGQSRLISDYVGSTKAVTLTPALTEAPANGVSFVILGRFNS